MNLELCDLYEDLQSEIRELSGFARLLLLSVQTKTVKDELEGQLHILCRCFRDLEKRADGFYPFLKNATVQKPEETPKDLPVEEGGGGRSFRCPIQPSFKAARSLPGIKRKSRG